MTKNKLIYEKPSMKVIILKQQARLLVGSGGGNMGDPDDYQDGGNPFSGS